MDKRSKNFMLQRSIYLQKGLIIAIIIPIVLLGQYLNEEYRPKAYASEGMSLFIAGSASGFFSLILMVLLYQLFRKKHSANQLKKDILLIGFFYNVVEVMSLFSNRLFGTFDIMDMVAYSLATGFMYLIASFLFRGESNAREVN